MSAKPADPSVAPATFGQRIVMVLRELLPDGGAAAAHWRGYRLGEGSVTVPDTATGLRERIERARAGTAAAKTGDVGEPPVSAWNTADGRAWLTVSLPQASATEHHAWLTHAQPLVATVLELAHAQSQISELERSKRLQQALYEIADLAGADLEMIEMLRRIHGVLGTLMYAGNCYIVLYDDQRETMRFLYFADKLDPWVTDPDYEFRDEFLRSSLTYGLVRHGQPIRGPSAEVRKVLGIPRDPRHGPDSLDWLGVPMKRGDRVIGAVVVQNYDTPASYDDADRLLLGYVAQHILTAVERRQMHIDMEQRIDARTRELQIANRELNAEINERKRAEKLQSALFRITDLAMSSENLQSFYADVHAVVNELIPARNFFIALLSDDGTSLEFPYYSDEHDEQPAPRKRGVGLTEFVIDKQKPLLVDRAGLDALMERGVLYEHGSRSQSWLGVPLLSDGRAFGVVAVQSYTPEIFFTSSDQSLLAFVAAHIGNGLSRQRAQERLRSAHAELEQRVQERTRELADANFNLMTEISERLNAEQRLLHQATHDSLTGLPNRAHLRECLATAFADAQRDAREAFAVLFMDLNRFKLVNDSIGHAAGDNMLVEIAQRIVREAGAGNVVARLGGDEFAVLVRRIADNFEVAAELADRLLAVLGQPMWVAGRELFPSTSIGIAFWRPQYRNEEDLLRDADAAMYRAKSRGGDCCELFDEAMREAAMRALDFDADLRRAINNRDFVVHYQPIARISDGQVVGHEALLRWRHEKHGLLTPGEFVSLCEHNGLIEQIDWLVYEQVAAHLARDGEGYVSVNVSPLHFHSADFAERLLATLAAAGAEPSRLRLEITEVALLEDTPHTLRCISILHEHDVLVFLDDFGTGFSALSYLHRFPISVLKIDGSFITGIADRQRPENLAVVRAIVVLAHTLEMETVAEGVETPEQLQALRELGCTYVQGKLIGAPSAQIGGGQIPTAP